MIPWYAPSAEDAAAIEAALDATWPGHAIDVVVGEAPAEGDVILSAGDVVVVRIDDRMRHDDGVPPALQVVLVRSWLAEDPADVGWVPAVDPVAPVVAATVDPPRERPEGLRILAAIDVGAGVRSSTGTPHPAGAVVLGLRRGRVDGFVRVERDVFDAARLDGGTVQALAADALTVGAGVGEAIGVARTAGLVGVGWRPLGDGFTATVALGARESGYEFVAFDCGRPDVIVDDCVGLDHAVWESRGVVAVGGRFVEDAGPVRIGGALGLAADAIPLGTSPMEEGFAIAANLALTVETR